MSSSTLPTNTPKAKPRLVLLKCVWNLDQNSIQEWSDGKAIESPVFESKNFDIKFKFRLFDDHENRILGVDLHECEFILVSSKEQTVNMKIFVNHVSKNSQQNHEKKDQVILYLNGKSNNSIECELKLIPPSKLAAKLQSELKRLNSFVLKSRLTEVTFTMGTSPDTMAQPPWEKSFACSDKNFLSARSSVFEELISYGYLYSYRFEIVGFKESMFEELLDFVYMSRVKQLEERTFELLDGAYDYGVKTLLNMCIQSLTNRLTFENVGKYAAYAQRYHIWALTDVCSQSIAKLLTIQTVVRCLILAQQYNLTQLKAKAIDLIHQNAQQVTSSEEFVKKIKPNLKLMQQLYADLVKKFDPQTDNKTVKRKLQ